MTGLTGEVLVLTRAGGVRCTTGIQVREPLADRGEEAPNFEFGKLVDLVIFFCSTCEEDLAVKVGASLEKALETEGTIGTTAARAEVENCAAVLRLSAGEAADPTGEATKAGGGTALFVAMAVF